MPCWLSFWEGNLAPGAGLMLGYYSSLYLPSGTTGGAWNWSELAVRLCTEFPLASLVGPILPLVSMPMRIGARKKPLNLKPQSFSEVESPTSAAAPMVTAWGSRPAPPRVPFLFALGASGVSSGVTSGGGGAGTATGTAASSAFGAAGPGIAAGGFPGLPLSMRLSSEAGALAEAGALVWATAAPVNRRVPRKAVD